MTMKFACLVYIDEAKMSAITEEEGRRLTDETIESDWQMRRDGLLILSQPLQEPSTAITMRVGTAGVLTTDGPFAETKEHLGGFYIIEAESMAEAKRIVETDPIMRFGCIEIRPTLEQTHSVTGEGRPEARTI
jgi:hypothetical protein